MIYFGALEIELLKSLFVTFDEDSDDEMKHPEFVVKLVLYFCNRLTRGLNQK